MATAQATALGAVEAQHQTVAVVFTSLPLCFVTARAAR